MWGLGGDATEMIVGAGTAAPCVSGEGIVGAVEMVASSLRTRLGVDEAGVRWRAHSQQERSKRSSSPHHSGVELVVPITAGKGGGQGTEQVRISQLGNHSVLPHKGVCTHALCRNPERARGRAATPGILRGKVNGVRDMACATASMTMMSASAPTLSRWVYRPLAIEAIPDSMPTRAGNIAD